METIEAKDGKFSYLELHAVCEECGKELYLPELNDKNAQAREDSFRKAVE